MAKIIQFPQRDRGVRRGSGHRPSDRCRCGHSRSPRHRRASALMPPRASRRRECRRISSALTRRELRALPSREGVKGQVREKTWPAPFGRRPNAASGTKPLRRNGSVQRKPRGAGGREKQPWFPPRPNHEATVETHVARWLAQGPNDGKIVKKLRVSAARFRDRSRPCLRYRIGAIIMTVARPIGGAMIESEDKEPSGGRATLIAMAARKPQRPFGFPISFDRRELRQDP